VLPILDALRTVIGLLCFLVAAIAAWLAIGLLGLALTPQDSSVPATGEWGYALIPGGVAVGAFSAGIILFRRGRDSR
jgi:TRAP-type C4-dicarboxylate transport system permease small subunit